jgi:hypothetical protein
MEQVQVSQADLRCGSSGPAWAKLTPGAEGRVPIKPFGLTGHQTLRFTWSNNEFDSLDQNLPLFLRRLLRGILAERAPLFSQLLPEVAQPDIRTNSGSWSIY